jgi:hypothetical protein
MPKAKRHRTSEREMRIGALRVAASKPNSRATTTQLKDVSRERRRGSGFGMPMKSPTADPSQKSPRCRKEHFLTRTAKTEP